MGTFFHKCAKKEILKAEPIVALQYNHISDSLPLISDVQINKGSIKMPLANNIEKPINHQGSFFEKNKFFDLLWIFLIIFKLNFYLNISIPGMFGIPSFATAANSVSWTFVAFSMALFKTLTK